MRRLWWLLIIVVVAGAGFWFWRSRSTGASGPGAFITAPVERGAIVGRVTATGTLSALVTVQVGSQVSGRIASLNADFNSSVKKGQVLAKLDPQLFEAAVAQARANELAATGNLAKAKAQAADAERQLARQKQLVEQKLVSQADFDSAQAARDAALASVTAAEGSVAQARASRQQADVNLGYTTIVSPIDGTVISRAVDVGQTVAASLSAPTLFTIAENLSKMQVDTNVAEADVGKLREGLDASFTVDAFTNRVFQGRIRQIRFAPQVVSNVVTYDSVIDVENPELLLRPGMTANVTFIYARAEDVLRVPNAALRFRYEPPGGRDGGWRGGGPGGPGAMARGGGGWRERSDGGEGGRGGGRDRDGGSGGGNPGGGRSDFKRVWVLRDGQPAMVRVEIGLTDGSFTEITGGELQEGDAVIVDREGSTPSTPGQQRPGGGQMGGGGMRRFL